MAYETIIVDIADDVALITLNRPDAMNALNAALLRELGRALDEADRSEKVRAIVIAGSDKAFAAGADVAEMADKTFAEISRDDAFWRFAQGFAQIRKPVIAAVSGYALGGGCELMMMCDMAFAAEGAKFGQPEVNLGIIPGMGGSQRLTHAVGKAKAMDMILTGRFMDAAEAERAGLVSRVVPGKKLIDEAKSAAHKIAGKSLLAAAAAKEAVNRAFEAPLAEGARHEALLFRALFATEDQAEGMAAFREKREPQFRDR